MSNFWIIEELEFIYSFVIGKFVITKMVNLLIAIHCHQPVGNFDKVFTEAFEKSYLPFIQVLEKHPQIKLALHYSGSLLDWLSDNRPAFIDKIKSLVKKGQVEIFAGGYYEPILTLIPENDALAQIELLKKRVKELFSFEARGGWIAERVWEPKLPKILAKGKTEYGVIDDSHFRYAGKDPEALNGFYVTEEAGSKFNIFPGSEKLRYLWPFKLPQETLDYLRARERDCAGNLTITFGDDGEKFGLWPGTHKWVYQENWLDNFFKCLEENSSWIKTQRFCDYASRNTPAGRAYLPCASYREMMEWSEGFYRNFMVKYPEANNMHKKMLYVSSKLNSLKPDAKNKGLLTSAKTHLYKAQANDSYWHGVFGGLYLNHLRYSVYQNLIEAEKQIDKLDIKNFKETIVETDFDCDGKIELLINTKDFNLCLRPEAGASLSEWDYKHKSFNLVNTLARRVEPYHKKIKELILKKKELSSLNSANQPLSIHDSTQVKDKNLDKLLFYDKYPRYCLLDHFLASDIKLEDFASGKYREMSDFVSGKYRWEDKSCKGIQVKFSRQANAEDCLVSLTKTLSAGKGELLIDYDLEAPEAVIDLDTIFGVEFNFSGFNEDYAKAKELKDIHKFILNDTWNRVKIEFVLKGKTNLWIFPVETVSESETGIEKSCQELCLFFWRKINLKPRDNWQQSFKINISA